MEHAMRTQTELDVRPIGGNIGAEIHGIDVTALSADTISSIRAVWLEHLVVVIRGQDHIGPAELASFAAHFGEPYHHALMPERADPVHAINIPAGGYWHSDVTFAQTPPAATMLHARRIPPRGGDTMWANMYLAYETLSPAMRTFLDGLTARHDFDHFYRYPMGDSLETDQFILDQKKVVPLPTHPVVREHPETGRKALFVNDSFTSHIEELTRPESDTILALLYRHSTRPELTCRHRWSVGDIAFWDNRCTMHYPIDDWNGSLDFTQESTRQMNRITIQGEPPRSP
jgi:taurine dioxygenase